jgi:hypothetical protein
MTDIEIMSAIGADFEFGDEQPAVTKTKKSFLQKLTERHGALKLHMRSVRGDDLDQDEQRQPSRTSSSSSAQKDFFKMAPVVWTTKSDRTKNDFAMRYDDIADDSQPSPIIVQSPSSTPVEFTSGTCDQWNLAQTDRQFIREFISSEITTMPRLHSSHSTTSISSSCGSPRTSSSRSSPIFVRSRSLPSEMSDEQMDAWLEEPEDAEVHRHRKDSANSMLSNPSPTMSERYTRRRKETAKAMWNSQHPVVFRKNELFSNYRNASWEVPRLVGASPASVSKEATPTQEASDTASEDCLTFSSMPVEVVLEVSRHLDMKSAASCRSTCKKLYDTVPAPLRPLALKKT